MLTIAPLPKWTDLVAFIGSRKNKSTWKSPWCREGDYPFLFSRSAWTLQAIVFWWEAWFNKNGPVLWVPDYFCNQSLEPIRKTAAKLCFYPIDENLIPQWNKCKAMTEQNRPDIFLLVHYFGFPSDARRAKEFCQQNKTVLVEDAAHILYPITGVGEYGDFTFYSPHKLLSIPDGSVLTLRSTSEIFSKDCLKQALDTMKVIQRKFLPAAPLPIEWIIKRTLQKVISFKWLKSKHYNFSFSEDEEASELKPTPQISSYSLKSLQNYSQIKLQEIADYRRRNDLLMQYIIKDQNNVSPFFKNKNPESIPYLGIFRCLDEKQVEEEFQWFKKNNFMIQSWPDLPPEVRKENEMHETAIKLRKTIFTFPVHQSLKVKDLVKEYCRNYIYQSNSEKNIKFIEIDRFQWEKLMLSVEKSNLLQSWAYGEAKSQIEGWKVKRLLINQENEDIAIIQVLKKGLPFFGEIVRINRGPLWLKEPKLRGEVEQVFGAIRRKWSLRNGHLLFIAPELLCIPSNQIIFSKIGYHSPKGNRWRSIWLDLRESETELRKKLDSKWRNQLNTAERAGLELIISNKEEDFQQLIENYKELMQAKQFTGPSIQFLKAYREQLGLENAKIFQARYFENIIARILVVRHDNACTYLIGWNSIDGRRYNANNFLLWNAILEMKRAGCLWFDLGGIDDTRTPSITKFKKGMGGEEYELVGEFF